MGSKIGIRIISISLALFLLGLFFPGQAKATISLESSDNPIKFGGVAIDSAKTISVGIKNQNETAAIKLYFRLDSGDTCGFSFDLDAEQQDVLPGEVGNMDVIYEPTELVPCSGSLIVLYIGGGLYGNLPVPLEGTGVPDAPKTVMIDGRDTGVEDREFKDKLISEWLEECAEEAKSHRHYVWRVRKVTKKMKRAGLLNREEKRAIVKCAREAKIPAIAIGISDRGTIMISGRDTGLKDREYDGYLISEWLKECADEAENHRAFVKSVFKLVKEMKKKHVITKKEKRRVRRQALRAKRIVKQCRR